MAKKKASSLSNAIAMPTMTKADIAREKKWQAESDLRIIKEAADIQKDKARLTAAKTLAKEQMADLQKVCK